MDTVRMWIAVNPFVFGLLFLMIADVVTGVLVAIVRRQLDSTIGRTGLAYKAGLLVLVLLCKGLEVTFMRGLPVSETVALGMASFEITSLIENFGALGIKADVLAQYFAKLQPKE